MSTTAWMMGVVLATVAGAWATPDRVAPETWSRIERQLDRATYEFREDGGRAVARNRAQDFRIEADRAGVAVAGGLRLRAVGVNCGAGAQALPEAAPVAAGTRVEYRRGPVTEWYENRAEGLEQGFTVNAERPTALDVAFETDLTVEVAENGQAVWLKDERGKARYRYGGLKVTDATGRQLPSCFDPTPDTRHEFALSSTLPRRNSPSPSTPFSRAWRRSCWLRTARRATLSAMRRRRRAT